MGNNKKIGENGGDPSSETEKHEKPGSTPYPSSLPAPFGDDPDPGMAKIEEKADEARLTRSKQVYGFAATTFAGLMVYASVLVFWAMPTPALLVGPLLGAILVVLMKSADRLSLPTRHIAKLDLERARSKNVKGLVSEFNDLATALREVHPVLTAVKKD